MANLVRTAREQEVAVTGPAQRPAGVDLLIRASGGRFRFSVRSDVAAMTDVPGGSAEPGNTASGEATIICAATAGKDREHRGGRLHEQRKVHHASAADR